MKILIYVGLIATLFVGIGVFVLWNHQQSNEAYIYESGYTIESPIANSWKYYKDFSQNKFWVPGFVSLDVEFGKLGENGSIHTLRFKNPEGIEESVREEILLVGNFKIFESKIENDSYQFDQTLKFESLGGKQTYLRIIQKFKGVNWLDHYLLRNKYESFASSYNKRFSSFKLFAESQYSKKPFQINRDQQPAIRIRN